MRSSASFWWGGPLNGRAAAHVKSPMPVHSDRAADEDMRRLAWEWALANRAADGSLPSGKVIGGQLGRHERWGPSLKALGS